MSIRRIAFVIIGMMVWLVYLSQVQAVDILKFITHHPEHVLPTLLVFLSLTGIAIFFVRKQ
jgi:hypothetical protein